MRDISTFSAAIFDMDGTLVDSMSMWSDIDREYLAKYGIPMPPDLQKAIDPLTWDQKGAGGDRARVARYGA